MKMKIPTIEALFEQAAMFARTKHVDVLVGSWGITFYGFMTFDWTSWETRHA